MDKLKINDLLRYAFSGGISLLTLVLLYSPNLTLLTATDKIVDATFIGVLSLLAGSLIYSLHRALIYPLIYRLLIILLSLGKKYTFDWRMLVPWRPTALDLRLDTDRWKRRKDPASLQTELTEWASQIHFLYTTSWAIIVASYIGSRLPSEVTKNFDAQAYSIIGWINLVVLVSALITHWRHVLYEHHLYP